METAVKKASYLLKDIVTLADYVIFRMLKGFGKAAVPSDVKRILVVERLFLGDLIVITPVLRALKKRFPDANLDVMIQPSMVDVLSGNPNISEIIPVSDDDIRTGKALNKIRDKYDLGIILNYGSFRISRLLRDAGIRFRVGSTKAGLFVGRGFFLQSKTKPTFKRKHKVDYHLDVVRSIGIDIGDKSLELFVPADAKKSVDKLLLNEGVGKSDFVVVIHAAPQHRSHQWSCAKFAKVADYLVDKKKAKIIFTGSEKDRELVNRIRGLMRTSSVDAAGKTSIKEFFALISRADLLVSVDTSAMHVGAAVGTPTVALFGAGNPRMWRPYGNKHAVIYKENESCTGCMRHSCLLRDYKCMRAIRVHDILRAVDSCLDREKVLKNKVGIR